MKNPRRPRSLLLGLLALAVGTVLPGHARAAFVLTLSQVGNNVVLSGTGSFNTTALTPVSVGGTANLDPPDGFAIAGSSNNAYQTEYDSITGPASFGTGNAFLFANATTGFTAGLSNGSALLLGLNYVSGTAITNSATFNNTTIAATGATPGVYVYTWGSGASADSLTLNVGAAPEPSTWAMMGVGIVGLGVTLRQRRRARLA